METEQGLHTALSQALNAKGEMELELKTYQEQVEALRSDLDLARQENGGMLDSVTATRDLLERAQHREADALERLSGYEEEVRSLSESLAKSERGRDRLVEWALAYVERAENLRSAAEVWSAWNHVRAKGTMRRWRLGLILTMYQRVKRAEASAEAMQREIEVSQPLDQKSPDK